MTSEEKKQLRKLKDNFNLLFINLMDETDFDLLKVYPNVNNIAELHLQLIDLKKCLDSFRPFSKEQLVNLQESFDIEYTYESNRIEGNTLTLMETDLVIHKGMTIDGKSLQEHQEAINHQDAIHFIREIVQSNISFNEQTLLKIHTLILQGIDRSNAGVYRRDRVRISGSRHICPNPIKIPELMTGYFDFYEKNKNSMHPVELSANMHEKLVTIHPFIDGNGRTARLVMNLILLQNGYPITIINSDNKRRIEYYTTLEIAQTSSTKDNTEFQMLVGNYVKDWMFKYLNMLAPSINQESQEKGYYFFKKIETFINQ